MKKILVIAFFAMCFSGCVILNISDIKSVAARGNQATYEFKVGEYSKIRVEGLYEIHYYAAPSDTVTLAVQSNVREYYRVEVKDDELIVRTTRTINFGSNKAPVLTVSTPVLDRLIVEGASSITTYNKITANSLTLVFTGAGSGRIELDVDSVSLEMSGAGKYQLSGRADYANFNMSGAGELNALSLPTREAVVNLSGAGTARVSCSENLRINANGAGTVEYRGSPTLNINRSGVVSIRQIN